MAVWRILVKVGTFGKNLRVAVAKRWPDLSAAAAKDAFGHAMGVGESQINKWYADSANPQLKTLLGIAATLGVSVESLCAGINADYDATRHALPFAERLAELWTRVDPLMRPHLQNMIQVAAGEPAASDESPPPES